MEYIGEILMRDKTMENDKLEYNKWYKCKDFMPEDCFEDYPILNIVLTNGKHYDFGKRDYHKYRDEFYWDYGCNYYFEKEPPIAWMVVKY